MLPRLLLVADGVAPPASVDELEDWIRLPADERDVAARLRSLSERAWRSLQAMVVVDGRGLQRGAATIPLSPAEVAFAGLLVADPGRLVPRSELAEAIWVGQEAPERRRRSMTSPTGFASAWARSGSTSSPRAAAGSPSGCSSPLDPGMIE